MTEDDVDILSMNSAVKRRRLPFRMLDLIPIFIAIALAWRLFVAPQLVKPPIERAPDLMIPALDGPPISLAALKGRVVFIDFFATWCGPCRQAMPVMEAYAAAHPEVQIISVDVGEPPAAVRSFLQAQHLNGPARIALDRNAELNDRWQIRGFPTIIAIDQGGFVRDHWFGYTPYLGAELADAEKRYFAERRDAKKAATASRDS